MDCLAPDTYTGEIHVRDNAEAHRFEIAIDGQTAFLQYLRKPDRTIALVHTEVPPALQGRGLAGTLAKAALEAAAAEGLRVVAICPFVKSYIQKHPAFEPLLVWQADE